MFNKVLLLAILFSLNSFAAGRITAPTSPAWRCNNQPVDAVKCETIRQKALASGCVTEEEANQLREYGAFPVCSEALGEGLQQLGAWCSCGCFAALTEISAVYHDDEYSHREVVFNSNTFTAQTIANNFKIIDLVHLASGTTLSEMHKDLSPIRIASFGKEKKDLIKIVSVTGKNLFVTEKHPILTSQGEMKLAKELRPSDYLVDMKGNPVGIKSLSHVPYNGYVYNFATEAKDKNEHVIFAEGFAVGDLYWQSSLEDEMNQVFLRK